MRIRAVICDIYKTVLAVGPGPSDAVERWAGVCRGYGLGGCSLEAFGAACEVEIRREHERARAVGIQYPEVFWPEIVMRAWPELGGLGDGELERFMFEHAQMQRTVALMPGAGAVLGWMREVGFQIGIASNAQPYTLLELESALSRESLTLDLFDERLCFWSWEAGFSKPDPHVFRWLGRRLKARGIQAGEILMVGDRLDNDVGPARAQGWNIWRLTEAGDAKESGGWIELKEILRLSLP